MNAAPGSPSEPEETDGENDSADHNWSENRLLELFERGSFGEEEEEENEWDVASECSHSNADESETSGSKWEAVDWSENQWIGKEEGEQKTKD